MIKLSKKHFWEWFVRNQGEYSMFLKKKKKEKAYWVSELNAHLRAYHKFFGFSFGVNNRTFFLVISCQGKIEHFKRVDDFVSTAPKIQRWKIYSLMGSLPIDYGLEKEMTDTGIDPREMYFSIINDDPQRADIMVYHPLHTLENDEIIYRIAWVAVHNMLGERYYAINIASLNVDNLSCADKSKIFKLLELPEHIIEGFPMRIDNTGNLVAVKWYNL